MIFFLTTFLLWKLSHKMMEREICFAFKVWSNEHVSVCSMKKFRAKNNLHGKKRLVVQISHIHITHTSVRLLLSTTTIVIGGTLQKVGRSVDKTVFCVKSNNFFFVKPIYAIVECGLLIRIMYAWVRKIILNFLTIDIRIYNVRPNPSALHN